MQTGLVSRRTSGPMRAVRSFGTSHLPQRGHIFLVVDDIAPVPKLARSHDPKAGAEYTSLSMVPDFSTTSPPWSISPILIGDLPTVFRSPGRRRWLGLWCANGSNLHCCGSRPWTILYHTFISCVMQYIRWNFRRRSVLCQKFRQCQRWHVHFLSGGA